MRTRRAAIYCRISSDVLGDGLGVTRQERDCRELCARLGWEVADVYVDDDVSAFSGKPRPEYLHMLEDIEGRRLDAIVAWHPDRLHRSPLELEHFITLIERSKATVSTCQAGEYDLTTPSGRMAARIVGAVARGESEHKSDRVRRKHTELREKGRPGGGGRPYGYDWPRDPAGGVVRGAGTLVVVPQEAEEIRKAAERILAGDAVNAVVADLNERGVPAARGGVWRRPALVAVLAGPTIAARRRLGDDQFGAGAWDPILDDATWARLRAMLRPSGGPTGVRRARCNVLSGGVLVCGRPGCGAKLVGTRHGLKGGDTVRVYVCRKESGGCGRVQIQAEPLEEYIRKAIFDVVEAEGTDITPFIANAEPTTPGDDPQAELAAIKIKVDRLATAHGEGDIEYAEWMAAREPLRARRADAQRRYDRTVRRSPADAYIGQGTKLRDEWDGMSLDRQRTLVRCWLECVIVGPATRRGPGFDEARLDAVWRH